MKFILRSLIVFAAAVGLGVMLYFAIQALPNDPQQVNPPPNGTAPQSGSTAPGDQTSRPNRPENNRTTVIRWGAIARIARRTLWFSGIVFVTVLAKNIAFGRKAKKTRGS